MSEQPWGELNCLGQFQANTSYKGQQHSFLVYVIPGGGVNNLLSHVTAADIGLVTRINQVSDVFGSCGRPRTEPVKIVLKEDAQPNAVHAAMRVPLPVMAKVKKELNRMGNKDIAVKVTEMTGVPLWCQY